MSILQRKLKISEYGVFSGKRRVAGRSEEEVFSKLGMQYIPPEMREDTGEVALALEKKIPRLIERRDIKGDLHAHSRYSDGSNTIAEMARAAEALGYAYIALGNREEAVKSFSKAESVGGTGPATLELARLSKLFKAVTNTTGVRLLAANPRSLLHSS